MDGTDSATGHPRRTAARHDLARRLIGLSPGARYGFAIVAALSAVLLRLALNSVWTTELPFITAFPAIMLSAWVGGFWPGVVTTALCSEAAIYFWMAPGQLYARDAATAFGVTMFATVGIAISLVNEAWRRGMQSVVASEKQLTRHAQLLETINDAICETDSRLRITGWSDAAERLYGYAAAEALGQDAFELLRATLTAEERVAFIRTVERGRVSRTEAELRRKDGAAVWAEISAIAQQRDQRTLARIIIVHHDISIRRRADERFRLAVEAAPAAMLLVDRHGTIVLTNALTERLLGYRRDELVGKPIELLVPARFREHHPGHRGGFYGDPRQRPMGAGRDLYALHKDGSEVPVEIGLSPIETAEGPLVLAAVTDITGRKEVEHTRAQLLLREQSAREALERASRLKDEFLAVLSHELRTPLNAVLGYAHMLRAGGIPADRLAHALEVIERNAHAQARLVDSLLDLSRVLAGKLELKLACVDLFTIIGAAFDVVRPDLEAKGITLEISADRQQLPIVADPDRLQQVFWNLLSNAGKFTPSGGRIDFRVESQKATIRIQVRDTGRGISPDFLPHVFDRFRQENGGAHGSSGGLGLGLALVREVVQAHGGTIVAESLGEGLGSTFTISLPVAATSAVSSAADRDGWVPVP